MTQLELKLSEHHDVKALAKAYAKDGIVRIKGLFPDEIAEEIFTVLKTKTPWHFVHSNKKGAHRLYGPSEWKNTPVQKKQEILQSVLKHAELGFAYVYWSYPMASAYKEKKDPHWPLHSMIKFLNSDEFKNFVITVTNEPSTTHVGGQATLYAKGHFLNVHDDIGADAKRRAAYVMGFTKNWHINYGGQLLFLDKNGEAERGFNPSFNTLTLFKVPRRHIVTQVANFTPASRFSITGWLHGKAQRQ